jgi:hypothetical protein
MEMPDDRASTGHSAVDSTTPICDGSSPASLIDNLSRAVQYVRRHEAAVDSVYRQYAQRMKTIDTEEAAAIVRIQQEYKRQRTAVQGQLHDLVSLSISGLDQARAQLNTLMAGVGEWEQQVQGMDVEKLSLEDVAMLCLRVWIACMLYLNEAK